MTVKRRTLVAGAAWSIPPITIASPALAYQLSANFIEPTGEASKLQGNSCNGGLREPLYYKQGYRYYFNVTNGPGKGACIEITGVKVGGVDVADYKVWQSDNTVSTGCCGRTASHSFGVPAATIRKIAIDIDFDNSANSTVQVFYSVRNSATCVVDFPNLSTSVKVGTPPTTGNCAPF